jgi:hypothetical protein
VIALHLLNLFWAMYWNGELYGRHSLRVDIIHHREASIVLPSAARLA